MAEANLAKQCSGFPANLRRQRSENSENYSTCNCRFPFYHNSVFCADNVSLFLRPLLLLPNDAARIHWLGNNIISFAVGGESICVLLATPQVQTSMEILYAIDWSVLYKK